MKRGSLIRLAVTGAVALMLAAAAVGLVAVRQSGESRSLKDRADAIVSKKGSPDAIKAGRNAEAAIGANEVRGADSSPGVEAALRRAYPAAEVSSEATLAAQNAWASLNAGAHSTGTWQLIGPSKATYPAVLNALGDGAQYVTAGRVTAMAIGSTCVHGACPVYVAAAGGGIWRTSDGLAGHPNWEFVSGSFGTNAIGSLIVAPNDASGN